MQELFRQLYDSTQAQEETEGGPLWVCGLMFNTDGDGLNAERCGREGGQAFIYDGADLAAFLTREEADGLRSVFFNR